MENCNEMLFTHDYEAISRLPLKLYWDWSGLLTFAFDLAINE
jgi:hypothetical protein